MLTIHDRGFARDCQGLRRRELLRIGVVNGAGGKRTWVDPFKTK